MKEEREREENENSIFVILNFLALVGCEIGGEGEKKGMRFFHFIVIIIFIFLFIYF